MPSSVLTPISSAALLTVLLSSTSVFAASVPQTVKDTLQRTASSPAPQVTSPKKRKFRSPSHPDLIHISASRHSGGGGMMVTHHSGKTVSTITSQYIEQQSPMTSVADLVSVLPGVVSAGDGTGTTTFQQFSMRGMGTQEIGFLLEGMPASNAFTYSAYANSLLDNQNIGSISVMQGSVDTNAAVYNATGGQISLTLKKPSDKRKITVSASGGSFNAQKQFMRIDSGEIGNSGVRAFISGSHQVADMWRGAGGTERYHVDAALTKQWSNKSETEALFGWNQGESIDLYYPTMAQWSQKGTNFGTNNDPTSTSYYKYSTKHNDSFYGTLKNHFDFGHGLSLDAQAYSIFFTGPYTFGRTLNLNNDLYTGRYKFPAGTFNNQAGAIIGGNALTVDTETWSTQNSGLNLTGTWKHKFNTLKLGYWYSYAVADDQSRYHPVTASGAISPNALQANGHYLELSNNNTLQQLNQLSIDDKMSFLHDKLTLDAGLRLAMVNRQSTINMPLDATVPYPHKQINNIFVPSPQMLITYKFNAAHQIYVNATTGYHIPSGTGAQVPSFNVTQAKGSPNNISATPINGFKPEYMINEEIGYRYNGPVMFNAAGFHYLVSNHQVSTTVVQTGCSTENASSCMISQTINAGNVEAFGAQIELATRPWHHFSAYLTGSYLHTRVGNNIPTAGDFLPTKGKQTIDAPQFMGTAGLSYDDGKTFGRFNLHYIGKQYATLMNDAAVPAYISADLTLGRRLPKIWHIAPIATLNLTNLGDSHYLSYTYGSTGSLKTVRGINGSQISGSAPTYGIAQGFAVTAGLSGTFE